MLQAMKHRGPDSTGFALYRGDADTFVMHVKLSEAVEEDAELASSASSASATRSRRGCAALGAEIEEIKGTPRTMTVDLRLRRRPEAARRRGRAGPPHRGALAGALARDRQGPRRRRDGLRRVRPRQLHRHPRDRPRADGDRVRRRHRQRPSLLGLSVPRRRRRPQRPAHQLPRLAPAAAARRPPLPVRLRLGDHRRLPRPADERGQVARGGDARQPRRSWTGSSPTSA